MTGIQQLSSLPQIHMTILHSRKLKLSKGRGHSQDSTEKRVRHLWQAMGVQMPSTAPLAVDGEVQKEQGTWARLPGAGCPQRGGELSPICVPQGEFFPFQTIC